MAITLRHHGNGSYTVGFSGVHIVRATVTSSCDEAFKWVRNLHSRHPGFCGIVIGLAIEQRPVLPSSADQRKIAVLQLSVDHQCLIFQIALANRTTAWLRWLLDSHTCRFVSVDAAAVADRLRNEHELVVRNVVDLGELAAERTGRADLRRANVSVLAKEVAGIGVNTGATACPWDEPDLSMSQVVKACADAFLASEVGRQLLQ